jgi:hypothetical protein
MAALSDQMGKNVYRPGIEQGNTIQKPELTPALAGWCKGPGARARRKPCGRVCRPDDEGIARPAHRILPLWTPSIGLDGTLDIQYRPDPAFSYGLNIPSVFTGTVLNRENIGKTSNELANKWNEENPGDLVVGVSDSQQSATILKTSRRQRSFAALSRGLRDGANVGTY